MNRADERGIGAVDKLFVQEGRKVFKEVCPAVAQQINEQLADLNLQADQLSRLWLHQANRNMNDLIARRVLGREPTEKESPTILDAYANTSSAGSIIAFHLNRDDLNAGELGVLCSLAPGFSGVALWVPPGVHPDLEPIGALMVETIDAALHEDLFGMLGEMAAFHPKEDHWYLAQIGVDPFYQAQGVGAALMKHALARCDTDGTPCYLESSNPRNISLYERFGFERVGEIQVGRSPIMTPMIRPAQG